MNKIGNKELARALADKFKLDKASAEKFVGQMFDVVIDSLKYDKQTKVKGLGTFKMTSVAPRKSVDVNTGDPIIIEGRDKINFTADTAMRDRVNRPFSQFETVVVNDGVDFDEIDQKFAESMKEKEETDEREERLNTVENTEKTTEAPMPEDGAETKAVNDDEKSAEPEATDIVEEGQSTPLVVSSEELAFLNEEDGNLADSRSEDIVEETADAPDLEDKEDVAPVETNETCAEKTAETDAAPMLSAAQLAVLNGRKILDASAAMEVAGEEIETAGALAAEEVQTLTGAAPIEPGESAETLLDDDASNTAERELEEIKNYTIELKEEIEHQHRNVKILMTVGVVLLLACVGGIAYMASQLQKRNNRIEHLEAAIVSVKYPEATDSTAIAESSDAMVADARKDSAKTMAESAELAKEREAEQLKAQQEAEQKRLAAEKQEEAEAKRKAEEKKAAATKQAAEAKQTAKEKAEAARQDKYNSDVRIRTGAYRIVGIDHTVTVRAGQTLTAISKAALGPGMECYVEAVNNGRTEFKAGEKINIPKLQLKKK